jgi:arabinogalactan oligomer / maltooligosaccharide transport system permease protein
MFRRSPFVAAEARPAFSPLTQITFSYFVLFLFTLFLLCFSLTLFPERVSLANFHALISDRTFLRRLGDLVLIALAVSIPGVALASIAGYAFSRFCSLGRSTALPGLLVTQLFPAMILLLPLFFILLKLGLINSYFCVLILYALTALPFCIWQMKRCYDTIPIALQEAALLDGCNRWQLSYLVILPLAAPALVIVALFSFLAAWNEAVFAPIVLRDLESYFLPLGLKVSQFNINPQWGLYAAGALVISIPIALLFLVMSTFLCSGVAKGEESKGGLKSSPAYHS